MLPAQLVVGAVLVDTLDRPTRMLAARRTRPPELAGQWELPGGKVEPGEAPEEALRRELREELGVTVRLGSELLGAGGGPWPLTPGLEMRVWWCVVASGRPQPVEAHDALTWVGADTIADLAWLAPDRPLVELVRRRLAGS